MAKRIRQEENALFIDANELFDDYVEDDVQFESREHVDVGCITLGAGSLHRRRPGGYGPDADFSLSFD